MLLPVIKACEKIDNIKYSLVLSGSHVVKKSILNDNEVKLDNLKNIIKLDISNNFKESAKMAVSVSRVIKELTIIIQRIKPNILIIDSILKSLQNSLASSLRKTVTLVPRFL